MEDLNRREGQVVQFPVGTNLLNDQLNQPLIVGRFGVSVRCMVRVAETKT